MCISKYIVHCKPFSIYQFLWKFQQKIFFCDIKLSIESFTNKNDMHKCMLFTWNGGTPNTHFVGRKYIDWMHVMILYHKYEHKWWRMYSTHVPNCGTPLNSFYFFRNPYNFLSLSFSLSPSFFCAVDKLHFFPLAWTTHYYTWFDFIFHCSLVRHKILYGIQLKTTDKNHGYCSVLFIVFSNNYF